MRLPFLRSVVPPHVFCLLEEGVTYARVREGSPSGFEESRHFRYPAGPFERAPTCVSRARRCPRPCARRVPLRAAGSSRASVVYPDAWARILRSSSESLPSDDDAGREMVAWKLKKLLRRPRGSSRSLARDAGRLRGEGAFSSPRRRAKRMESIEAAFEELGVRVGYLARRASRSSRACPRSSAARRGRTTASCTELRRHVVLHRAQRRGDLLPPPPGRRRRPRSRGAALALVLRREAEGTGLSAVYVHDELPGGELRKVSAFPVAPVALSAAVLPWTPTSTRGSRAVPS
jgi:hypothetical protein